MVSAHALIVVADQDGLRGWRHEMRDCINHSGVAARSLIRFFTGRGFRGSRVFTGRGSRGSRVFTRRGFRGSRVFTGRGSRGSGSSGESGSHRYGSGRAPGTRIWRIPRMGQRRSKPSPAPRRRTEITRTNPKTRGKRGSFEWSRRIGPAGRPVLSARSAPVKNRDPRDPRPVKNRDPRDPRPVKNRDPRDPRPVKNP